MEKIVGKAVHNTKILKKGIIEYDEIFGKHPSLAKVTKSIVKKTTKKLGWLKTILVTKATSLFKRGGGYDAEWFKKEMQK